MKTVTLVLASLLVAAPAFAASSKTYQVTGPIVDVKDDAIVVEKGKEKWEIARDSATKVEGELKKGAKVTVHYRMTATSIEAKEAKGAKGKSDAASKPAGKEPKPAAHPQH